ncbi:DUF4351 domain-containing protein, partial [Prosthecobacter sp. SYSU 5D2]|uniref:DUF4351 domain-containing protein n=1 Tax=Prosthecobacter sp. SYSU 5D2 TaxID=3134134 RepID=UPI0031FF22E3
VYAFNVDSSLDLEQIARRMEDNRTLRNQTMSIAQKLIAQGREEGYGQGVLKTCLRLARKKWGALSDETIAAIESLNYGQLEQLTEDLLDMSSEADLKQWMQAQAGH